MPHRDGQVGKGARTCTTSQPCSLDKVCLPSPLTPEPAVSIRYTCFLAEKPVVAVKCEVAKKPKASGGSSNNSSTKNVADGAPDQGKVTLTSLLHLFRG
ncbi:hypothetical protein ZHAS_00010861 [Anopheles sinensis]|uniref:Uncharacterized protein n=1 Tax=Anopheles sinensis TaxID=74873 RepID=A0A084VYE1_ANOSI|nr:hypothetical protein ZHAS_00010861 [Anopheles sinensis]